MYARLRRILRLCFNSSCKIDMVPVEEGDEEKGMLEAEIFSGGSDTSYEQKHLESIMPQDHSLHISIKEPIFSPKGQAENPSSHLVLDTPFSACTKMERLQGESLQSFVESGLTTVGRASLETLKVPKLSLTLLKYLGIGYKWMNKFGRLTLYAMFLLPGFLQVGYSYFRDKRIQHSVVYGSKPRNRLDLYVPENTDSPKPVIAFITGGAWIIGYKAWGSLLGLQLVEKDVMVACIDYRNFPQGTISDMVEDAMQGISFICSNVAQFGGDPERLFLAGQSAGAHIAACALVEQAIKEIRVAKGLKSSGKFDGDSAKPTWKVSQIKGFFGISGGYNLHSLVDHFHNRGLYRSLFLSIMEGQQSLSWFSPELRVKNLSVTAGASLPPIFLFHGKADYSIPCTASKSFAEVLVSIGAKVTNWLYEGKTHTDIFLQDPMRGGHDALVADIWSVVYAGDHQAQVRDSLREPRRRLVPEFLLKLAGIVSPF